MFFRQFQCKVSSTYTYLLAAKAGQSAVIIDPVADMVDVYLQEIKANDLTLKFALDTHVHADHITGSGQLHKLTGCEIAMSSKSKATGVTKPLTDNQVLAVGDLELTVWHTPGHTDDSVCYLLDDKIFTGDLLFINGTGRTDFQNGSAHDSYLSITKRVFSLRDETLVYPGHDYEGRMVTTVGEAKRFNPRLLVGTEKEYVELMDGLNLAPPKLLDVAVPANLRCGL